MSDPPRTLRIGTRRSLLARKQTNLVVRALRAAGDEQRIEIVPILTTGDRTLDRSLHEIGGKGLFTRELEVALLDDRIDVAVHSLKDMPVTMPLVDDSALVVAAIPRREDVRDALISNDGWTLESLRPRARVGTCSLRRRCQLLAVRPDLQIEFMRGNIDTRLAKVRAGDFDAIMLAMAGLLRAELFDESTMKPLPLAQMLPAAGQGALALQCRADDNGTHAWLAPLDDAPTRRCCDIEREIVRLLNGDCHSPIAARAEVCGASVHVLARVGRAGGELPVIEAEGNSAEEIVNRLKSQGADELLHSR